MVVDYKEYKNNYLTFIVTGNKVIVRTPLQAFYLQPVTNRYSQHSNRSVIKKIESGKIDTLNYLASICSDKIQWVYYPIRRIPTKENE